MRNIHLTACVASLAVAISASALAQEAPVAEQNAAEAQVAPPVTEDAASSEEWAQFSNNDRTIYLIDLKSFKPVGDATAVRIARVPTQGGTTTFMHRIDEYEIRCRQNQARMLTEIEFDDAGAEIDRYPEAGAEWDTMLPASLPAYFKAMPCEGARPNGSPAPSIKAFIERGRQ